MAKQDYLADYTRISYHNVGDLAWRLRLNTNLSLSLTSDEALVKFNEFHIRRLTNSAIGTVVRGRYPSDPAGQTYLPSSTNETDFVRQAEDNIFTGKQLIPNIQVQSSGSVVQGTNSYAYTVANTTTLSVPRELPVAGAGELYTMVSDNVNVGGKFVFSETAPIIIGIPFLPNTVFGAALAGQVGLSLTNDTTNGSTLNIENLTGSTITIILTKES